MPCYHPLEAWRSGDTTSNGKKRIVFQKSEGLTPITLPCGQCIGCRLERSREWAIRCTHEAQSYTENSFITLTYSDQHLPSDLSLTPSHFTKFMKRLRKEIGQNPIYGSPTVRYFMCGEYGEKFDRPHYHACLFGITFPDKDIWQAKEEHLIYRSDTLDRLWSHGLCTISDFSFNAARYCANYVTKKITGEKAEDHYQRTHPATGELITLHPEYARMSTKPGLGHDWFMNYFPTDVFPQDFIIHDKKRLPTPRYYEKLYERLSEEDLERIKLERKQRARKHLWNNTPDRLAVREKIKKLQLTRAPRSYEHDT